MDLDFPARAHAYAQRVLSGEQVAGKWVKAAARRHLDDIERQSGDWPYYFDELAASRVCMFIEMLPHIEGRWKQSHIKLEDWQIFILCSLFGWLHKETKLRRFRRFYEEVARKNGKSPIAAGICLYLTFCDGELGAQVYSFATGKDQAKIVWKTAKEMVRRESDFAALGAAYNTSAIYSVASGASFKPLAKNFGSLDGLNTHGFMADELHAHKERGLYDVLDSSTGAREQPLGGAITTAGSDQSGICYEVRGYVLKILNAVLMRHGGLGYEVKGTSADDDTWFGIVFTIDEDDDPFNEACWIKANPNLGVSVKIDDMRALATKAKQLPSALGEFLTKKLNHWVGAATAWLNMLQWHACADPTLKREDFVGEDCIAALDLASKIDIAVKILVFKRDDKYYVFLDSYLPESAIEESKNSQYKGWVKDGWLKVTPGQVTDYDEIESDILADCSIYSVAEVPYDPFQATQLAGHMLKENVPMVEFRQTVQTMSEPMKTLEALVKTKLIVHDGNPVLAWMMSNVVCWRDKKDNIYPRKENDNNKIDGAVALIMALGRWIVRQPSTPHDGELLVV